MKLISPLCGLCLAACLAMLPLMTPRTSAPPVPPYRAEIAATRQRVQRSREEIRRQQAKVAALERVLLRKKESGRPPKE